MDCSKGERRVWNWVVKSDKERLGYCEHWVFIFGGLQAVVEI